MMLHQKRYILFLGDSFCADMSANDYKDMGHQPWQSASDNPCHTSLVAEHYGLRLACHGYGGKSWWYSRYQFEQQLYRQPDLIDKIDAMVFFHTNWDRINTNILEASTISNEDQSKNNLSIANSVQQAQLQWFKYLYDHDYQWWAGQKWFQELSTRFSDKKQVHFHCFTHTQEYNHLLIGQRFTTPLIHLSMGELTGTQAEIDKTMALHETRDNHFSAEHNRILADIIIESLDNYQHQSREIDISQFKIVNMNATNFPNGYYGTR